MKTSILFIRNIYLICILTYKELNVYIYLIQYAVFCGSFTGA